MPARRDPGRGIPLQPIRPLIPARLYESPACEGIEVNEFFEFPSGSTVDYSELRAVCGGCHVLEDCREWAIANEEFGFWGGMTALERQRERIERGIVMRFRVKNRRGA
jgi:hypothetical protein